MARTGRPPKGSNYKPKGRGHYRFSREVLDAVRKIAKRRKITQTDYIEEAIRMQLEVDGVQLAQLLTLAPENQDAGNALTSSRTSSLSVLNTFTGSSPCVPPKNSSGH